MHSKSEYRKQLKALVKAAKRMRSTAIVDDDFPAVLDKFDGQLALAELLLKADKEE